MIPFLSWRRSSHALPPLRAGLSTYLYLNTVPEASTELHLVHSLMIHGSGTKKIKFSFKLYCLSIILFKCLIGVIMTGKMELILARATGHIILL